MSKEVPSQVSKSDIIDSSELENLRRGVSKVMIEDYKAGVIKRIVNKYIKKEERMIFFINNK